MLKVLRVSHSATLAAHRRRDEALAAAGVDVTLVLPTPWTEPGGSAADVVPQGRVADRLIAHRLPVARPGDVNRHRYLDESGIEGLLRSAGPDLLDLHEEPFSVATRQWLRVASRLGVPTVLYTAQNLDKRFPPPFAQYETSALRAAVGIYPCSRQAGSVVRGKGFDGVIQVLPLGYDPAVFTPGEQSLDDAEVLLGLVGRLVPEKGVVDAVEVLAAVHRCRPARLVVIGSGPEAVTARRRAAELGVADRLRMVDWVTAAQLAEWYRRMHVVLVPSRTSTRWVEQFGRIIVEGRAGGAVVVGYANGAIPEVIGETGIVVPEGDVAGLAAATVALLVASGRYERLRAEGLLASQQLTWPVVARRQCAFYRRALDEVGTPLRRRRVPAAQGRALARAEFGAPATVFGIRRPFALPVLRDQPKIAAVVAGLIDAVGPR